MVSGFDQWCQVLISGVRQGWGQLLVICAFNHSFIEIVMSVTIMSVINPQRACARGL